MADKKRLPPWEEAKLVFKMQEETRKRKLLEKDMQQRQGWAKRVGPNTSDELEENRKRLRALQKRIENDDR
jgi:hypothetical protein